LRSFAEALQLDSTVLYLSAVLAERFAQSTPIVFCRSWIEQAFEHFIVARIRIHKRAQGSQLRLYIFRGSLTDSRK